jgi:hypothetical protein
VNSYPVTYQVEHPEGARNRLTVGFRAILAIPHMLLVGGPGFGLGEGVDRTGGLGAVAGVAALINWFIIVFKGTANKDLMNLQHFYLRWRARAIAYEALLRDEYPPFGDAPYPVSAEFPAVAENRNRWTVGFRFILIIPQAIVFLLVAIAWVVTLIIAWFAILFSGRCPEGLWTFGEGVIRWSLRVEAYWLLLTDEYPPFSLE